MKTKANVSKLSCLRQSPLEYIMQVVDRDIKHHFSKSFGAGSPIPSSRIPPYVSHCSLRLQVEIADRLSSYH